MTNFEFSPILLYFKTLLSQVASFFIYFLFFEKYETSIDKILQA
jgi:hypothetical protein